jgi:HAD superfamily hydrolase (TIGR01509 family)
VFDMDGLLVDSEALWAEAERELFARHGHPDAEIDAAATHGRSIADTIDVYTRHLGPVDPVELEAELLDLVRVHYEAGPPLMAGARSLLERLAGRLPLAIASNSNAWLVRLALDGTGLLDVFGSVVSGVDVERAKPHPDVYLTACRELGVAPSSAIAFEDSPAGVRAAVAAGLTVVGVPERAGVDLAADGATLVLASLEEVEVSPG